ncbi:MAG TPA: 2-amino-4-hydroxy-6-hydroxymethyldihydropteridine diphosphokinase, partial [Opitutales bacterium]|nr:2-amino-4-hydroxy-6-hydroxymethyldihydropteridine diphosphokinase [Opitutales bacterium]
RTLDLDLLLFEGESRSGPTLELPHPRIWERAFVLVPLAALLTQSPRFQRPCWDAIRVKLARTQLSGEGVVPWKSAKGKS